MRLFYALMTRFLVTVAISLALATLLAACASASPASTPTSVPTTTATPLPSPTPTPTATATPTPSAIPSPTPASGEADLQLPVTVTSADGKQVTVTAAERIVSLGGTVTEIVFALGLGPKVVGADSSSSYPPEATQGLPKTGYVHGQLSAEGILSLQPTVVIGPDSAGPPAILEQVRSAGVPVVLVAEPNTLAAPITKIRAVAEALGIPQRGEELASAVQTEIKKAQEAAQCSGARPRVLFLYLRGTNVQNIGGANTAIDPMIQGAGGVNAGAEAGIDGFKAATAESIVATQPEVILVLANGLQSVGGVDGLLGIPGIAQTPAGQQRRVIAMDDLYLLGLGPRMGKALAELAAAFCQANSAN